MIAKKWIGALAVAGCLVAAPAIAQQQQQPAPRADLILTNGQVYTSKGWAEAIAVRKNVIVGIGTTRDMIALGENARVIDLGGKTVMPGLNDMHVHTGLAETVILGCKTPAGGPVEDLLAALTACAAKLPPGQPFAAGMFDPHSFPDRTQIRALLDKAVPNNPVIVRALDGHTSAANSAAIKLAGVTAATPTPVGGFIGRDAKGEPTGLFGDRATGLLGGVVPRHTAQQSLEALRISSRLMASFGITSYTEAGGGGGSKWSEASDRGWLLQRTRVCMGGNPYRNLEERPLLENSCVKMFSDGTATNTHTAFMLEPYLPNETGKTDDVGFLMVPEKDLAARFIETERQGLALKVHACGDGAVRAVLNAFETMRKTNGPGRMHEVAHWCFAKQEDIARARDLNLTVEISAYLWSPSDPIHRDMTAAVGAERMEHFFPAGSAIRSGANVTLGSDWPCVESPNPWPAIESLVTRRAPGDTTGPIVAPEERITLEQAIATMTTNPARQLGQESRIGRLEVGLLADMIVLDRNPFDIPITQVGQTKVLQTFVNGKLVYDASVPAA